MKPQLRIEHIGSTANSPWAMVVCLATYTRLSQTWQLNGKCDTIKQGVSPRTSTVLERECAQLIVQYIHTFYAVL